jgi:peptide/nickel transport system ATP-binding protein
MSRSGESEPVLSVRDLSVEFDTYDGTVRAVDGATFEVAPGETVCLVGESGAGKTVTCEAITGLIPTPPGTITDGTASFDGMDLLTVTEETLREVRGDRIAYVFQHPGDALDPVYTVGRQLVEVIRYHDDASESSAKKRAVDLLDRVDIANPARRLEDYPHELSGGLRQRVVIAMALANDPDLLIADEPTTDLDVTVEAQILDLLKELQADRDMAVLYVTHDLGVVAGIADRVVVMYAGEVVERARVDRLFGRPAHPYTQALLESLPGHGDLSPIPGSHPDTTDPPAGCRFHPRCPQAVAECSEGDSPDLHDAEDETRAACVFYRSDRDDAVVAPGTGTGSSATEATGSGTAGKHSETRTGPPTGTGSDGRESHRGGDS